MTELTIIIPAYNESSRLPSCLSKIFEYMDAAGNHDYDVIVVDDGSDDGTSAVVERIAEGRPELSLIRRRQNRGKGEALRVGIMAAAGKLLLLVDADGATPIEEAAKLIEAIQGGADLAIGSRSLPDRRATRSRNLVRSAAGFVFSRLVRLLAGLPVRDSQCGFKMIRRPTGRRLIPLCRERGYLLDVELLLHAYRSGDRVAEVPVGWAEVRGSKVSLLRDGWKMARGLWALRAQIRRLDSAATAATRAANAPLAARFD